MEKNANTHIREEQNQVTNIHWGGDNHVTTCFVHVCLHKASLFVLPFGKLILIFSRDCFDLLEGCFRVGLFVSLHFKRGCPSISVSARQPGKMGSCVQDHVIKEIGFLS